MVHSPVRILKDAPRLLLGLLRLADLTVVAVAGWAAYHLRSGGADLPGLYFAGIALAMVLTANFMQVAGCYRLDVLQRLLVQVGRILGAWLGVILCLITLSFFTGYADAISQIWASLWFAFSFGGFLTVRGIAMLQIRRWQDSGRLSLKVALVGAGPLAQQVERQMRALDRRDVIIAGHYNDQPAVDGTVHPRAIPELLEAVQRGDIDEILIALPWSEDARIKSILKQLRTVSINVRLCPDVFTFYLPLRGMSVLAGVPVLNIFAQSLSGWNLVLKNLEDKILAPLLLLLVSPIFILIAVAVKLDSPGPVFFRQKRYGFNNNEITVLKFRSMRAEPRDETGTPQATRNDPRVTRIGRIIRRTSLDELPQLLNVCRGDMSLVGPRPHAVDHNKKYAALIDEYLGRHRMKPGITGWAQVNGLRGETPNPELMRLRVQHDLYYIEHWSLWLDIRILLMTAFVGFVGRRAY